MCTVVDRFMEEGRIAGMEEGRMEGITIMVETCQEFGLSKEATIERIRNKFSLSDAEAVEYVEKNWK